MFAKNDLRVWAVYDRVIGRIEYFAESQSDCRRMIELFNKSGRLGVELLRFDLSPLYYDRDGSSVAASRFSCSWRRNDPAFEKTTKTQTKKITR